jgi:hypothetical protein
MSQKLLTELRTFLCHHTIVHQKTLPAFVSLVQNVSNKVALRQIK